MKSSDLTDEDIIDIKKYLKDNSAGPRSPVRLSIDSRDNVIVTFKISSVGDIIEDQALEITMLKIDNEKLTKINKQLIKEIAEKKREYLRDRREKKKTSNSLDQNEIIDI